MSCTDRLVALGDSPNEGDFDFLHPDTGSSKEQKETDLSFVNGACIVVCPLHV